MPRRVPILLLALALLASCAAARDKALSTALTGLNAASAGLIAYDTERQAQIVEAAPTLEAGKAELVIYRAHRGAFVAKLEAAYLALASAAVVNDERSLASAIQAVALVQQAWTALHGGGK